MATKPPCREISDVNGVRSFADFPVFSPQQNELLMPHPDRNPPPSRRTTGPNLQQVSAAAPNPKLNLPGSAPRHPAAKRRLQAPKTVSLGCRVSPATAIHEQIHGFPVPERRPRRLSSPLAPVSQTSVSNTDGDASHRPTETSLHHSKEEVSSPPVPSVNINTTGKEGRHHYEPSSKRLHPRRASESEAYNSSKFAYGSPPSYDRALRNDFAYGSPPPGISDHLRQKRREEDVEKRFNSSPLHCGNDLRRREVVENPFYEDDHLRNQARKEKHGNTCFDDSHLRNWTREEQVETLPRNNEHLGIQTGKEKMKNPIYSSRHLNNQTRKRDTGTPLYNADQSSEWTRKKASEGGSGSIQYVKNEPNSSLSYTRGHQRGDVEDVRRSAASLKHTESPTSLGLTSSQHNRSVLDIHKIAQQMDHKESHFPRASLESADNKFTWKMRDSHNTSPIPMLVTNELHGCVQNLMRDLKQMDIKESYTQGESSGCAANQQNSSVQDVHKSAKHKDLKELQRWRASSLGSMASEKNQEESHFVRANELDQSVRFVDELPTDAKQVDFKESYFRRVNEHCESVPDSQPLSSDLKHTDTKGVHLWINSLGQTISEPNESGISVQENGGKEFERGSNRPNELNRSCNIEHANEPTVSIEFGCQKNKSPMFSWERRPHERSSRKTRSRHSISPNSDLPSVGAKVAEEYMRHERSAFGTYTEEHYEHDVDIGTSISTTYSSELFNVSSDHGSFGSTDTSELSAILQNYCDNHTEGRGTEEERLMEQEGNWSSSGLMESGERRYFSAESQLYDSAKKAKDKKCKKTKSIGSKPLVSGLDKSLSRQQEKGLVDSESLFHETIRTARGFLSLFAVSVMEVSNNEGNELLQVLGQPGTIFAHRHHMKYGGQALINKLIFQEFDESSYSGMNRIVDQSVLLNEFRRMSVASSVDAIGPSNEHYDVWFHRFCNWKLLLLEKNMPWLISWRDYVMETFLEAMKYVWKSHLLAQSSHGVINLFEVKQWTRYHGVIMEVVNPDHDDALFLPEVQLLVNPGFHLQHTTIKAQVYLLPRTASFDGHDRIKHKD